MDSDIIPRKSLCHKKTQLIVFPDADVSKPENESVFDIEAKSVSESDESSCSKDDIVSQNIDPLEKKK